jgi:hypothetical protein
MLVYKGNRDSWRQTNLASVGELAQFYADSRRVKSTRR